ncbi:MAG: helix-turn-helix transcriptional regulator [Bifidobacteriaceae bacterium]|nr:helix-turn-helix transcriptional regulator [Bifidobacteriaceae bacterium]
MRTVADAGARVRAGRRAMGLTQAQLAQRLEKSRQWVVDLEAGRGAPGFLAVVAALAEVGICLNAVPAPDTSVLDAIVDGPTW